MRLMDLWQAPFYLLSRLQGRHSDEKSARIGAVFSMGGLTMFIYYTCASAVSLVTDRPAPIPGSIGGIAALYILCTIPHALIARQTRLQDDFRQRIEGLDPKTRRNIIAAMVIGAVSLIALMWFLANESGKGAGSRRVGGLLTAPFIPSVVGRSGDVVHSLRPPPANRKPPLAWSALVDVERGEFGVPKLLERE